MEIPLTRGKIAIVDDEYAWLADMKWHYTPGRSEQAARHERNSDGTYRRVLMHRLIMCAKPWEVVDHINHNGLDNRCSNLRICTHAQNMQNRLKHKIGSSLYKGVSKRDRSKNPWQAQICIDGKLTYIGVFSTEIEAALAYNEFAKHLFGEFANLNIILDT